MRVKLILAVLCCFGMSFSGLGCAAPKRPIVTHLELQNEHCNVEADGRATCLCDNPKQIAIDARDQHATFRCE